MTKEEIDSLVFEPFAEWTSHGNRYQRSQATVNNVPIYCTLCVPYSLFKAPWEYYVCDLIIPDTTPLKNGRIVNWYEPDGFGLASFDNPDDAVEFCENYKHKPVLAEKEAENPSSKKYQSI
jgi:hypothetical protein